MIKLYQFKFSHFCEKARWALDYKGIPFNTENLLPGLHIRVTKKLAPKTSVPIIADGKKVVQGSTEIINYLDSEYPENILSPEDPEELAAALELEKYFDEEIGVTIRLWFYHYALQDRDCALNFLLDGGSWYSRTLFKVIFPKVRTAMMESMNINTESAKRSEERFLGAFDKLDSIVKDNRYLVGDSFSRADLTACALLSPFCARGKSDEELHASFPNQVFRFREKHKSRPFFSWVSDMYDKHR